MTLPQWRMANESSVENVLPLPGFEPAFLQPSGIIT